MPEQIKHYPLAIPLKPIPYEACVETNGLDHATLALICKDSMPVGLRKSKCWTE